MSGLQVEWPEPYTTAVRFTSGMVRALYHRCHVYNCKSKLEPETNDVKFTTVKVK